MNLPLLPFEPQQTLCHEITCEGVGLHSGKPVNLKLLPAPADSGFIFCRTDAPAGQREIRASYAKVSDTRLGTTIRNRHGISVATIEHLMAALWGCGLDNLRIEIDGPEVPVMDGSSEPFVRLIEAAGVVAQNAPRRFIRVHKPVEVTDGEAAMLLLPSTRFSVNLSISFDHPAIGHQEMMTEMDETRFREDVSDARTFGFAHEVEQLRQMGLARGGSLENAVVIGDDGVLNREGLRYGDEFVRHKVLDCIGDLFLAGVRMLAHVEATRTGHTLNNRVLHALFADPDAWSLVSAGEAETEILPASVAGGIQQELAASA